MTCARAELSNGLDVLELGCGWGSLSLFMARAYPGSTFTSVSNSRTQREFIMGQVCVSVVGAAAPLASRIEPP
jgi:cyclopropane-fatty-acyl-phospholipid synthase